MANAKPIIELKNIKRAYNTGGEEVYVLKGINLSIYPGEMVAIIGSSGSGKSTLMNILGCLDKASEGQYLVNGIEVSNFDADQLSELRREYFGFIFQRYHLLNSLTALGNVEIPAIYAGIKASLRSKKAAELLIRLGLKERLDHKPNQLSGGQQQRVSIARALINSGKIILADEPTGALDKQSGEEVLKILHELHQEGRTLIIVTHDAQVAKKAERIIEISDGLIISDSFNPEYKAEAYKATQSQDKTKINIANPFVAFIDTFKEALIMALLSLKSQPMRSFLTMLGIIIGIASVILMVALGNGTQQKIMENINSMGTNSLSIFAGKSMSDARAGLITTLIDSDATALANLPYVAGVSPGISGTGQVSYGNISTSARIEGASPQIFNIRKMQLAKGSFFDDDDVKNRNLNVVIDEKTEDALFGDNKQDIIGKTIFIDSAIARIVGIVKNPPEFGSKNLTVYAPYKALQTRLIGSSEVQSIVLRIADNVNSSLAEEAVTNILIMRHGVKDFFIINSEEFRKKVQQTMGAMTLLIVAIASISLLVGGIGVMNIMLVTVSERINEIGVRMAVGARQKDILQQFLIETIIVCMLGGGIGIILAFGLGSLINSLSTSFKVAYSLNSIVIAFVFSSFIGICFGFFPARGASKLNPVTALARD